MIADIVSAAVGRWKALFPGRQLVEDRAQRELVGAKIQLLARACSGDM